MRIVIATALWKRPKLTKKFLEYYSKLKVEDIELKLVVAITEEYLKVECFKLNIPFVVVSNKYVSKKFQSAITLAKEHSPDYVVVVGSDDFISPSFFSKISYFCSFNEAIGFKDLCFYDTKKRDLYLIELSLVRYLEGFDSHSITYLKNEISTLGAFRVYGKGLLASIDWILTEELVTGGVDNTIDNRLKKLKKRIKSFSLSQFEVFGVDIKYKDNIWKDIDIIRRGRKYKLIASGNNADRILENEGFSFVLDLEKKS